MPATEPAIVSSFHCSTQKLLKQYNIISKTLNTAPTFTFSEIKKISFCHYHIIFAYPLSVSHLWYMNSGFLLSLHKYFQKDQLFLLCSIVTNFSLIVWYYWLLLGAVIFHWRDSQLWPCKYFTLLLQHLIKKIEVHFGGL